MRNYGIIFGCLIGLGLLGWIGEYWGNATLSKTRMQMSSVPVQMISSTKTGEILRKIGMLDVIPNDYQQYGRHVQENDNLRPSIFKFKRNIGIQLYTLQNDLKHKQNCPSSTTIDRDQINDGFSKLSLFLDENDLFDEKIGIVPNALKRGRKWERTAFLSYFKQSKLVFETGIGLRIHGGWSRKEGFRKNYRIHFRDEYGKNQFKPGVLFDQSSIPLKCLVVRHNKHRIPFCFNIAMDIAERIGCIVPKNKVVKLYLNGKYKGIHSLFEHIDADFLQSHFGHNNFVLARTKIGVDPDPIVLKLGPKAIYDNFLLWRDTLKRPLKMQQISQKIDLDNLCRWIISNMFCETNDAFQGSLLLDLNDRTGKWFWINWDMDQSLCPFNKLKLSQERPFKDYFDFIHDKEEIRMFLFRSLLEDSVEFQNFFRNIFNDVMEFRLDAAYIKSLIEFYDQFSVLLTEEERNNYKQIHKFLFDREKVLKEELQRYFLCQL